jgi:hypothetical protein
MPFTSRSFQEISQRFLFSKIVFTLTPYSDISCYAEQVARFCPAFAHNLSAEQFLPDEVSVQCFLKVSRNYNLLVFISALGQGESSRAPAVKQAIYKLNIKVLLPWKASVPCTSCCICRFIPSSISWTVRNPIQNFSLPYWATLVSSASKKTSMMWQLQVASSWISQIPWNKLNLKICVAWNLFQCQ